MSRKIVTPSNVSKKDENGMYVKESEKVVVEETSAPPSPAKSIDDLFRDSLLIIERTIADIRKDTVPGPISREQVSMLKDLVNLLFEFKQREQDLMETLTDEELERLINANAQRREEGTS